MPPPIPATVAAKLRLQQDPPSLLAHTGLAPSLDLKKPTLTLPSSRPCTFHAAFPSSACRKLQGSIRAPLGISGDPELSSAGIWEEFDSSSAGAAFLGSSHLHTKRSQSQ